MGLLSRLRDRLRPPPPPDLRQVAHTELGGARLADGTVLERCLLVDADALRATLDAPRDRLVFHFRAADPGSAHDLHELRELHLYYSKHADLLSVALDLEGGGAVAPAGLAVDAFHRDHGLTWQSLLYDGRAGALPDLPGRRGEVLPQVALLRADGTVAFHRAGPWAEGDRPRLELLLTGRG